MNRRGSSSFGCLSTLLVLTVALYIGVHVGEPYVRYLQFRDAVRQEARFATLRTDDVIRQSLRAAADSLALPSAAGRVRVMRSARAIRIWSSYTDSWAIHRYTRPVRFRVDVRSPL